MSIWVSKYSGYYVDFRSQEICQKKCTENKLIPKTVFPKIPVPIVLVIFNIKGARYLVLFAGKSTR
jgi:hypothetical protein